MNMLKRICSVCVAAAILCCTTADFAFAQSSTSSSASGNLSAGQTGGVATAGNQSGIRDYRIGPGDLLDMRVMNEPQFDGTFEVESDGGVFVPFIDDYIPAKCRTVDEIRADVLVHLATLLRKPRVSLIVKEKRSRSNAVIHGAVRFPQQFQMYRRARLLEIVGYAGGFTEQANGVIRVTQTEPVLCPEPGETLPVVPAASDDLTQLPFTVYKVEDLKTGKLDANPVVRPGDIISVEEAAPVYVTGLVVAPQGVYLRPQSTLTTVIAQVGGMRKEAKNEIKIYRKKPNTLSDFETIAVNYNDIRKQKTPDVVLQPYDVVDVGESSAFSRKRILDTVVGFATQGAGQVITSGATRVIY